MLGGRSGLGRGLGALLPGGTGGTIEVDVEAIAPNPRQPRHRIDPEQLAELAASVRQHGVIQPLIVRAAPETSGARRYELIAGERRWQAARLAGLTRVPAIVKEVTPQQLLELALVENIQRADLNPLEEAAAFRQLVDEFGLTHEQVARRVGKNRVTVTNAVRLLALPNAVKDALAGGTITGSHAKALLSLPDEPAQLEGLRRVVNLGLTARQTEQYVRGRVEGRKSGEKRTTVSRSLEMRALEDQLRVALGTRVKLESTGGRGHLSLYFYSEEELRALVDRILGA